jgi:hypothetical protein
LRPAPNKVIGLGAWHMTGQLRENEEFVMEAVSKAFSGTWRCGEDPPDAYLTVNNGEVAVEISILMQSRFDGRGGTVSLLSDAMPPTQLVQEVNKELQGEIPDGRDVILGLRWPISNVRKVKEHLKREIRQFLSSGNLASKQLNIEGNEISIQISSDGGGSGNVTSVAMSASLPCFNVQETAWCALQERITAKAEKCRSLKFKNPIWLALYDYYLLADVETYLWAMTKFSVDHPFEKILIISRDGSVGEL